MKVFYTNMKLKTNTDVKTFEFGGQTVQVLQYLPSKDKYDLLMITLQKSIEEDGLCNQFKLNLYLDLHIVYMYTNISFTDKQKEDQFKLYDALKSNGFFDKLFAAMPDSEYVELFDCLTIIKKDYFKYIRSAGSIFKQIIDNLPINAEKAAKLVEDFDKEKFQAVVDFARYANGGRDIKTGQPVTGVTGNN